MLLQAGPRARARTPGQTPEISRVHALHRHLRRVRRGIGRQRAGICMQPLAPRSACTPRASFFTGIDRNTVGLEPLGPRRVCAKRLLPQI